MLRIISLTDTNLSKFYTYVTGMDQAQYKLISGMYFALIIS